MLLDQVGVPAGGAILDFGGGRGLVAACLARDEYRVTLCEINPSLICGTGAAATLRDLAGVRFEIVTELPDAERFDAVVCRAVLHHVEPLAPTLEQLHGLLRPGGALIASDEPTIRQESELEQLRADHPFVRFGVEETAYTVDAYLSALRGAGFVQASCRFPVTLRSYRQHIRPELSAPHAVARYFLYRLRSLVSPAPGDVRSFVARRAPSSGG